MKLIAAVLFGLIAGFGFGWDSVDGAADEMRSLEQKAAALEERVDHLNAADALPPIESSWTVARLWLSSRGLSLLKFEQTPEGVWGGGVRGATLPVIAGLWQIQQIVPVSLDKMAVSNETATVSFFVHGVQR